MTVIINPNGGTQIERVRVRCPYCQLGYTMAELVVRGIEKTVDLAQPRQCVTCRGVFTLRREVVLHGVPSAIGEPTVRRKAHGR
jgi:hypothetical protein